MSKKQDSEIEDELPSSSRSKIDRLKSIMTILNMVTNWESYPAEVFCLEEGLEHLIDFTQALISLPPERLLRSDVHDDPVDTDFHSENMIQKIIIIKDTPKLLESKFLVESQHLFEMILEALVTLRQDLYRDTAYCASESFKIQRRRIEAYLSAGLDPELPDTGYQKVSAQEIEERLKISSFISILRTLPIDQAFALVRKEKSRRDRLKRQFKE